MFDWFKSKNNNIDPIVKEDTEKVLPNDIKSEKKNQHVLDKLTIGKLQDYKDDEVMEYLKKHWNMPIDETIQVWGIVTSKYNEIQQKYYNYLINIKDNNGKELEYPVADLKSIETMQDDGVFISFNKEEEKKRYISCELELSNDTKKRAKNPILLKVKQGTNKTLDKIPYVDIIKNNNGDTMIERSIINQCIASNKEAIFKSNKILFEEKDDIKKEINLLHGLHKKQEQDTLKSKALNDIYVSQTEESKEEKKALIEDIKELKIQEQMEKEMYEKNKKEFEDMTKIKADSLLNLGFINKDQHAIITGNYSQEKNIIGEFLDFEKDLNGDFSQAISHIQAYLFSKNIIYRRALLEDYFALLKTNDLIILAGDSGSGKTNLVKKFAEAVGGKAKIIPVKPNWTSSDDLLGYYNPLQKTYLPTPFLEALLEAKNNPDIPYFICLDEMNLARVEYYFADFLSLLEERGKDQPKIDLYVDTEASHMESEFSMVLSVIESTKKDLGKEDIDSYLDILKDKEFNEELKRVFGSRDNDSLIKYHSDLKRMLNGILNSPSSIEFPKNVRIIGTVNIDETTHYLSPKILDRAHVIKLNSPSLSDWKIIEDGVENLNIKHDDLKKTIKFDIADFGEREEYPEFDPRNDFCKDIFGLSEDFLQSLGAEVSLRSIRQGLYYNRIFEKFNKSENMAFYNFISHKILPKFRSFDGNTEIKEKTKKEIMEAFRNKVKEINPNASKVVVNEINIMLDKAEEHDGIISYWI